MKLLREPLLHFLLLGALLFVAYGYFNREPEPDAQRIVVSPGHIEHMVTTFARTWQRPPTAEETKGLIDQFVREEICSREAKKLQLDENDTVIRRRLQQKLEFIAEDVAVLTEPTEEELAAYLAKHPAAFQKDARLTFRHVFLSPEKRGDKLDDDAAKLLADLKREGAKADTAALGDPTLLVPDFRGESQSRVESDLGGGFAAKLATLPVGEWSGPVASGYGLHLVFLEKREDGRLPALAEVRAEVLREWQNAKRVEANEAFLAGLLKQYEVTIEWPNPPASR